MKITKDPRCPKHPEYEADILLRGNACWLAYECSACNRPLGPASVTSGSWGPERARRKTPVSRWAQDMADAEAIRRFMAGRWTAVAETKRLKEIE